MQPYFYTGTGTQSALTIPLFLILFANLFAMKSVGAHENEATSENNQGGLFPALGVDKTMEVLNIISDSTMTAFQASKDTLKPHNTTVTEEDIIVSDETEDEPENAEEESYDGQEDDELDEDDGSEEEDEEEDELDDEDEELEEEQEEEDEIFQADVRSLSDLPLSRLLKVRGELQRIEEDEVAETRALGGANPSLAKVAKATTVSLGAAAAAFNKPNNRHYSSPSHASSVYQDSAPNRDLPSNKKKSVDSDDSKEGPPRRGGWHFDEEEEEEEFEEEHGWISSWPKSKKKKKGDISSVFQMSVTFLAFLAFGGYLLCLIVQAVKGGGPTGPSGDGYRPPMTPMVLMMPARLGVRRPRPPNPGRRRRRKRRKRRDASESPDEEVPWPTWDDPFDADGSGRLWPNVDLSNLQQVLFDISRDLAENGRI